MFFSFFFNTTLVIFFSIYNNITYLMFPEIFIYLFIFLVFAQTPVPLRALLLKIFSDKFVKPKSFNKYFIIFFSSINITFSIFFCIFYISNILYIIYIFLLPIQYDMILISDLW